MLTESFVASTLSSSKSVSTTALKDVGIFLHEFQPQSTLRNSYKKSSTPANCLAVSESHIFAAQADKAVIHVYGREKGNQEATVPFHERIRSVAYAGVGTALLVIGTEGGRLILWELSSGRQVTSTASHLQAVSSLIVTYSHTLILSGSADSNVHVWSLPNLLSFSQTSTFSSIDPPQKSPVRTFSQHRAGITALACGHSTTATNFAISASNDNTCYLWTIDNCEILKTILLPYTPLCFALDPADRTAYAGYEDGSIQCIEFYRKASTLADQTLEPLQNTSDSGPLQLTPRDTWSPLSSEIGPASCICISFDATSLLTGHDNGKVISWDVAKRRIHKAVSDFGHSVTNLIMLSPDGLPKHDPAFQIKTVVKPRHDSSRGANESKSDIPTTYTLNGQINPRKSPTDFPAIHDEQYSSNTFQMALTDAIFPQSMIDDALQDLSTVAQRDSTIAHSQGIDSAKTERLEEQIAELNRTLQIYSTAAENLRTRRMARMEKREDIGWKKRSAYFEAKSVGQDGDKAMEPWEEKERALEMESDNEEMAPEASADD